MADSTKFSFYESQESVQVFQSASSIDEVEITSIEVSEEHQLDEFIEVVEEERIELGSVVFSSAASQENNGNGCDNVPMVTESCTESVVDNVDQMNDTQPEEFSDCISMVTEPSKNNSEHAAPTSDVQPAVVENEARNDVDVIAADVENRPSDDECIEVNNKVGPTGTIIEITSKASNLSLSRSITSSNSGDSSLPSVDRTSSVGKGVFAIDNIRSILQSELNRGEFTNIILFASFKC